MKTKVVQHFESERVTEVQSDRVTFELFSMSRERESERMRE